MALKYEEGLKVKALKKIAIEMMIAARTAPKGKGVDTLKIAFAEKEDIEMIAKRMFEIDREINFPTFNRDAKNILNADAMIILGTIRPLHGKNINKCG
jgi:uncharacterized ferredoxin-like protein